MSKVDLQALTTFFDKIKIKISDFLLRREVEDFDLEILLLELLVKTMKIAISFEYCPAFLAVL